MKKIKTMIDNLILIIINLVNNIIKIKESGNDANFFYFFEIPIKSGDVDYILIFH